MKKKRIYLSGAMSGFTDWNFPSFHLAAATLREMGYEVFNPAEAFDGDTTLPWSTYMTADIEEIKKCDEVAVLEGWEQSVGARLEVAIARSLGKRVWNVCGSDSEYSTDDPREDVAALMGLSQRVENSSPLLEAYNLVHGNRGDDYGHPYYDFRRTAMMLSGLFVDRLQPDEWFTARDIPLIMNCVKMSREINKPKRDNRIDGAGYWETLDMVHEHESSFDQF